MSKVVSIVATYDDGSFEVFPQTLVDSLAFHQGDHIELAGFVNELLHEWDKEYALRKQEEEFESEKKTLLTNYKKTHEDGLNKQRGKQLGLLWDKWAEAFPHFPYNQLDIVPIPQPGDRLCFKGMIEDNITEIIWLEYQIKSGIYVKRKKQIKKCLEEGRFSYKLYTPPREWVMPY